MDNFSKEEQLQQLSEIRSLMERSSRFISLSGLSGVGAGVTALIGSAIAYWRIEEHTNSLINHVRYDQYSNALLWELIFIATGILIVALSVGAFFTLRKAKEQGQSIWDKSSQQLIINLLIPLVTGGLFCLLLLEHGMLGMVAPATLIFYGLALVSASKYTLNDIRHLGFCQIILGLLNAKFMAIGNGILFWTIGFGVLHIIYGIYMHYKYR
ncbi:hypothetical protein [Aureispira sp. CCB-E]|uniref:hypothetical protein n=1 Tax=Aureispira sp. CCB-E TaxID=3051121 RepID=UPI0028692901|nr:hypothetical protein [Aureispira sp. CCB-E]WMX12121.1 hypothetical protein QP953_14935 [Aureispira sp. CCB-E]